MFILVLMLRHSITKLREFGVNLLLPLDRHIYFHKITGRLIFVYGIVHTAAHLGNIGANMVPDPVGILIQNGIPLSVFNPPEAFRNSTLSPGAATEPLYSFSDWLFTCKPGLFGMIGGVANPTGVALTVIILVITFCSMKWVRKGGYFEVRDAEIALFVGGTL